MARKNDQQDAEVSTEEAMPEKPAERATVAKDVDDGFVAVQKGDQTIRINPACLEDHERLGWKAV